jgi:hypothetical protein
MKLLTRKYSLFVIIIIVLFSIISVPVLSADIGGKASLISNLSYADSELDNSLAAELELEWFLPYDFPLNIQNRAVISLSEAGEDKFDLWFKKLYLKEELGSFNVSIGRQPISWSYGALINPVDYSLGAENLEEESKAKFVDGLELYYPINWGSGLTFVASNLENQKEHKWALRGRTTFRGYDLSASYVNTPVEAGSDLERYGLTAKGDLGPVGLYGAYGLWQNDEIDYDIYQLGTDYSYNFMAGSRLYLQAEYLRLEGLGGDISAFNLFNLESSTSETEESSSDIINNLNFINTNLSYEIDEFSSVGIMTVSYLDDGSTLFIPNYSYLFGSNLLLELRGSIAAGSEEEVLGGDAKGLEINLSYTF